MRTTPGRSLFAALLLLLAGQAFAIDTSIYDIQLGVYSLGTMVTPQGVVVTGVGRFGFFVQEPDAHPTYGRQYSGIFAYTNTAPTVKRGDMVNVSGAYAEFRNRSEIACTLGGSYTKVGVAGVPNPVSVTIPEVNNTGLYSEGYEGVLIAVDREDNALVSGAPMGTNGWWLKRDEPITSDRLQMYRFSAQPGGDFEYDIPDSATPVTFAIGILDQFYAQYELCPRSCDEDLGIACKPRLRGAYATSATGVGIQFGVPLNEASAENVNNYQLDSGLTVYTATLDPTNTRRVYLVTDNLGNGEQEVVTVSGILSDQGIPMSGPEAAAFRTGITPIRMIQFVANPATNDVSPLLSETATIRGRVTALDGLNYYFLQDDDGREWDGIYVRVAKNNPLSIGDQVIVAGQVTEYFEMTEFNYKGGVDYFVKLGNPQAVTTNTLTTPQLRYRDTAKGAEPWEGGLVRMENARLDSLAGIAGPYYSEWLLFQQGYPDTAKMDFDALNGDKAYAACVGDIINVTGPLAYSFAQYMIWPPTGRGYDIQVVYDNPACAPSSVDDLPAGSRSQLLNEPNPFRPLTTIRFRLPAADQIRLEILDPSGRLVRTLADREKLPAGDQRINWDGLDGAGHPVAAGTYFARLSGQNGVTSRKLILLH